MFQKNGKSEESLSHESRHTADNAVDTVVGPSVVVEGDFASQGNIVVKGVVCGNVRTSEHLTVERGAKIMANVRAGSAVIAGEIRGSIKVKDTLDLLETARVLGDVEAGVLSIRSGAGLSGKCHTTSVDFSTLKNDQAQVGKNRLPAKKKKEGPAHDSFGPFEQREVENAAA